MTCIFCDNTLNAEPIEHIVPESLGNDFYILKPTIVCGICNGRFSKFEGEAISKSILGYERARLGVMTKKGKPGTGVVEDLKFTANAEFKKKLYCS